MKKIILLFLIILPIIVNSQIWQPQDDEVILDILQKNGLRANSLNFLKDWSSATKFKLAPVLEVLQNPLYFPKFAEKVRNNSSNFNKFQLICQDIYSTSSNSHSYTAEFQAYWQQNVKTQYDLFSYVELVWETTDSYYQKLWQALSPQEMQKLEYLSFSMWQEPQDSLKYEQFYEKNSIKQFTDSQIEDFIPILEKIDFPQLLLAQKCFYAGFSVLQENYEQLNYDMPLTKRTKWGLMHIGSNLNDNYKQQYAFILDLAGDDKYTGKLATAHSNPYFWHLDGAGNDIYQGTEIGELLFAQFGLAIHADLAGNDYYNGDDFSLCASFGSYIHLDAVGDDIYTAGLHSLAAASWGTTYFADFQGNDIYSCTEYGQGFASTMATALLYDEAGSDSYLAGGKYLHEPLAPLDYRSLSQGFGFGLRPDLAGGVGILHDKAGNDNYQGGVYAQGVAYWYALGMLLEDDGNDFYDAVYYPQGSGIHLAGGLLADLAGADHYYSKHGPGQGAGHDYAVGFFIENQGDDRYSVEGGNGIGLTNSVGIFWDRAGADLYQKKSASNYGYARGARDSGSIGIFVDSGGKDVYSNSELGNDKNWQNGDFGLGVDSLSTSQKDDEQKPDSTDIATMDFDENSSIEELFSIAAEWNVGSNKNRVQKARELLFKKEPEAAEYIFEQKFGTKSGLEYRAVEDFTKKSEIMRSYFPKALLHSDSLWVKNAINLIATVQDSLYLDDFANFLAQNKYTATVLGALGEFNNKRSREILADYINSSSEKLRFITARSLKKIKADKLLKQMQDDDSFLVRTLVKKYFSKRN
jgi:hypothetical protein